MIKVVKNNKLVWHSREHKIYDLELSIKTYFCGIKVHDRTVNESNKFTDKNNSEIGFKSRE